MFECTGKNLMRVGRIGGRNLNILAFLFCFAVTLDRSAEIS